KPEASDRSIAKQAKVSDKTVGAVRRAKERRAEIPHVTTRTDTKGRKQPTRKAWSRERYRRHRAKKRAAEPPSPDSRQQQIANAKRVAELLDAAVDAQEHNAALAGKLRAAEIKIAGLESEIEELKGENAKLREQLEAARKETL